MKQLLLLMLAVFFNAVLMAQFKIEKVTYFLWSDATQSYSTDTLEKWVMKFDNGEYAGYDRYYSFNTKRQSFTSKVFQNGVNDRDVAGFGTEMLPLERIESDRVGVNWEYKRKFEYVRDTEGAVVEFYSYIYNNSNWDLLIGHKYETYKTGNNVDSVIRFLKSSGTQFNWMRSSKNIYDYTGSEVSKITNFYYWQDSIPPDTSYIFYDIVWKDFDNRISPNQDGTRIGFLNGTLYSYRLLRNEKISQTDPDNWVYYDNNEIMYDTNDRIIELIIQNNYKYEYDYRSDGRQIFSTLSIYNDSIWQIWSGFRNVDTDDINGNYHIRHQQTYSTSDSAFVNTYRILFNDATITSVSEQEMPVAKVFPNPANDVLHIEMEKMESVEIMDITGRILNVTMTGSDQSRMLNVSSLPAGIYIVIIRADGKVYTSRVVKN